MRKYETDKWIYLYYKDILGNLIVDKTTAWLFTDNQLCQHLLINYNQQLLSDD